MGEAVERLADKLDREAVDLARVFVSPHPRVVGGRTISVPGYWREQSGVGAAVKALFQINTPSSKAAKDSQAMMRRAVANQLKGNYSPTKPKGSMVRPWHEGERERLKARRREKVSGIPESIPPSKYRRAQLIRRASEAGWNPPTGDPGIISRYIRAGYNNAPGDLDAMHAQIVQALWLRKARARADWLGG